MIDREIKINDISEETFQDLILEVNTEILKIAKEAQDKINELLLRFKLNCSLTLNYNVDLSAFSPDDAEIVKKAFDIPTKKKRTRKKKSP